MKKLDRLTAILIHLQTKRVVTADELAKRFEVSHRTIYRDINALLEGGVPICSEAGVGYYLVKGYSLPPLMFTRDEAASLLMAGKLFEKYSDNSMGQDFQSALYKIKAVLNDYDKDHLEDLNKKIVVHTTFTQKEKNNSEYLSILQKALGENRVVHISYYSHYTQTTTTRQIEPAGLCFYNSKWHLIAFCRLRNDFRDFRLDRVESLRAANEIFQKKEYGSFAELLQKLYNSTELIKIRIRVTKATFQRILNEKYYYGFISETPFKDDQSVEMQFMSSSLNSFSRWLLSMEPGTKIIEPEELKELVISKIDSLYKQYNS